MCIGNALIVYHALELESEVVPYGKIGNIAGNTLRTQLNPESDSAEYYCVSIDGAIANLHL